MPTLVSQPEAATGRGIEAVLFLFDFRWFAQSSQGLARLAPALSAFGRRVASIHDVAHFWSATLATPLLMTVLLNGAAGYHSLLRVDLDDEGHAPRLEPIFDGPEQEKASATLFTCSAGRCAPQRAPEERRWSPSHLDPPAT